MNKRTLESIVNKGILTHAGCFHADDTFSTALLCLILGKEFVVKQLKRVYQIPEGFEGLVYDIGGGEFDHHQKDNEIRGNGIPYASFGKLWRALGLLVLPTQKAVDAFDEKFVQVIDSADNGIEDNPLSYAIHCMNATWREKEDISLFWQAVDLAACILDRELKHVLDRLAAEEIIVDALEQAVNPEIIVFDRYVPSMDYLTRADSEKAKRAKFVVFPSNRGGWNIQGIPIAPESFVTRVPFPEKWLGNPNTELGMSFCHPGNFLAVAKTKEQAIRVAEVALGLRD